MENLDTMQGVFSIAVAAFLLVRMEKRLEQLTTAIDRLRHCQTCQFSAWEEEKAS